MSVVWVPLLLSVLLQEPGTLAFSLTVIDAHGGMVESTVRPDLSLMLVPS